MLKAAEPDSPVEDESELEQLLTQTQRMHDLAINGEWERVDELECERKTLVDRYFSSEAAFDDPQIAAHYVQEIIELNKKVITMGLEARDTLSNALGNFQRGRQAAQAYQKIGP